jgi:hypothetical protein
MMSTDYETLISRFLHPSATEPGFSGFSLFKARNSSDSVLNSGLYVQQSASHFKGQSSAYMNKKVTAK